VHIPTHCVDYIARAAWEIRRLAPRAKLLINEFGLEYDLRVKHDRGYHFPNFSNGSNALASRWTA
jgi:hypothetical protein